MYSITLLCTHHSELGRCNSDELYNIIDTLAPDIIFEELTEDLFIKFYKDNLIPFETPEIKAVKRYLVPHKINHFPVDITPSSNLTNDEINYMFNTFKKYTVYSKMEEDHKLAIYHGGYSFLNSKLNEEMFERKKALEQNLIQFNANKNYIDRIYQMFCEEQHIREFEIIKNIYNHSERMTYNQALLLIGSGHRKSIVEKIKNFELKKDIKLNWILYGE